MSETQPSTAKPKRKIGAKKEGVDPEVEDIEGGADVSAQPSPKEFRVRLEQLFLICLLGGLGLALTGLFVGGSTGRTITITSPILATLSYPVIGIITGYQKHPSMRERFADNCYYLGFIFTQGGLVFAFLPSTLFGEEITSSQVIQFFGMAIGAALIGLIARTILIQSSTSIADVGDQMHGEVQRLAEELARQSKGVIAQFETIAESVGEVPSRFAERLELQFADVDEALARIKASLATIAEDYAASRDTIKEVSEEAKEKSAAGLNSLEVAVRDSAETIRQFGDEIHGHNRAGVEAIQASSESLRASLLAFEDIRKLSQKLPDLEREVGQLKSASEEARKAATNLSDNLNTAMSQVEQDISSAVETGVKKIDETTVKSVEAYQSSSKNSVSAVLESAEKFRHELDEATRAFESILSAFNARLEDIGRQDVKRDG